MRSANIEIRGRKWLRTKKKKKKQWKWIFDLNVKRDAVNIDFVSGDSASKWSNVRRIIVLHTKYSKSRKKIECKRVKGQTIEFLINDVPYWTWAISIV